MMKRDGCCPVTTALREELDAAGMAEQELQRSGAV